MQRGNVLTSEEVTASKEIRVNTAKSGGSFNASNGQASDSQAGRLLPPCPSGCRNSKGGLERQNTIYQYETTPLTPLPVLILESIFPGRGFSVIMKRRGSLESL